MPKHLSQFIAERRCRRNVALAPFYALQECIKDTDIAGAIRVAQQEASEAAIAAGREYLWGRSSAAVQEHFANGGDTYHGVDRSQPLDTTGTREEGT